MQRVEDVVVRDLPVRDAAVVVDLEKKKKKEEERRRKSILWSTDVMARQFSCSRRVLSAGGDRCSRLCP